MTKKYNWEIKDSPTDRDVAYAFLGVCQSIAPNGLCQQQFANIYNDAQKEYAGEVNLWAHVINNLANALIQGLNTGNWPGRRLDN